MDRSISHIHSNHIHPDRPEYHHAYPCFREKPSPQPSSWLDRLTSNAIDPLAMCKNLNFAGESVRHQAYFKLRLQNGNCYIQRSGSGNQDEINSVQIHHAVGEKPETFYPAPEVGKQSGLLPNQLSRKIIQNTGRGAPLSPAKREYKEFKFGTPLTDVRLHTGTESDTLNQQLSAQAFTLGNDIFFSQRANPQDNRLLPHELTHVVQQRHIAESGPLTVGPADDLLERQARDSANSTGSNAYSLPFAQQRNQAIQRDFMDEFNLGNIAGVTGMGADISTGISQLEKVAPAQQLSMTSPRLTNLTQAPITGTLSKIAGPIGLLTGSMDMMNSKKPLHERIIGGMSALDGATGTASTISGMFGSSFFSAGGAAGMSAGAGSALTGVGAGLLTGAGGAAALGSLGCGGWRLRIGALNG